MDSVFLQGELPFFRNENHLFFSGCRCKKREIWRIPLAFSPCTATLGRNSNETKEFCLAYETHRSLSRHDLLRAGFRSAGIFRMAVRRQTEGRNPCCCCFRLPRRPHLRMRENSAVPEHRSGEDMGHRPDHQRFDGGRPRRGHHRACGRTSCAELVFVGSAEPEKRGHGAGVRRAGR